MDKIFSDKINLLKALAILVVVSGHLEFSLIPMFPPYSFQVMVFFFIAGILFNNKYGFFEYLKRRSKSLLLPYFLYAAFYLGLTAVAVPVIGKFWGMPITFKNELLMPFLTGHQLDLISPLWFVPSLFITLVIYKVFSCIKISDTIKLFIYLIFALAAIQLQSYASDIHILWLLRSAFSLFFVHLGYMYKTKIAETPIKERLFSPKIFFAIVILQSILWLTNKDFTPMDGVGLHFLLVWGQYNNPIVPILTSLTGIWMCLFIVDILYERVKDISFIKKIGQNSYHIMANHLLVFNIITYTMLFIKGIPFDIKNGADIYWFYFPLKTTYFYFVAGIILTVYTGELLKLIRKKLPF